ncbi:hypothetical protein FHS18_004655 [Paenibacillus phyllosphaerae]|uniref:Uncharacterized protein n=1 Tax=Paenibacillus phyllosphaerae TaxID=274593 RepID=A0A7W5B1T3_9BACL|nr:hypothetical protein [Paenibacillus phyllosphaerae]MBB3112554.1 hypothetical protein [Paenibacillus phyllosphaerae]
MRRWSFLIPIIYLFGLAVYIGVYTLINLAVDFLFVTLTPPAIVITLLPLGLWVLGSVTYYKNKKAARYARSFLIGGLAFGMLVTSYSVYKITGNELNSHFDAERWASEPSSRMVMVDHMLDRHKLKGRSPEEVHVLLGSPSQEVKEPQHQLSYYLGGAGFFSMKEALLVISFDQGQVSDYDIAYH